MASCENCGKKTSFGIQYARRGAPKRRGGSGAKISGKTNRTFKPNLQRIRVEVNGGVKRMTICARCIKSGKIRKAPRGCRQPAKASS